MASPTDVCTAATAVATFDVGMTAVREPVSSRDFSTFGVEDEAAAISRLATPCDMASVVPTGPEGWDRFVDVMKQIWGELTVDDLIENFKINLTALETLIVHPEDCFVAFVKNCFEYMVEELTSMLELIWSLLKTLAEAGLCQAVFLKATAQEFVTAILEPGTSFDVAVILGTMTEECELFRDMVQALGKLKQLWADIREAGFDGVVTFTGEVAAAIAEMLRDAELQKKAHAVASDPARLGGFYGTLVGFILWEVVESILTGPFGKAGKGVKVVVQ